MLWFFVLPKLFCNSENKYLVFFSKFNCVAFSINFTNESFCGFFQKNKKINSNHVYINIYICTHVKHIRRIDENRMLVCLVCSKYVFRILFDFVCSFIFFCSSSSISFRMCICGTDFSFFCRFLFFRLCYHVCGECGCVWMKVSIWYEATM